MTGNGKRKKKYIRIEREKKKKNMKIMDAIEHLSDSVAGEIIRGCAKNR